MQEEAVVMEQSPKSSFYLKDGESHSVWTPKQVPKLAYIVSEMMERARRGSQHGATASFQKVDASKRILLARQNDVLNRVNTTRARLRKLSTNLLFEEGESQAKSYFPLAEVPDKEEGIQTEKHPSSPLRASQDVSTLSQQSVEIEIKMC